jgi:hypothetical protein
MPWSFPGINSPVEMIYTQTLGVDADVALIRCNPQVSSLPASGTLTMTWGVDTVTLPNCLVDVASVRLTPDGRYVQLLIRDRRERWRNAAPISGEYNTLRAGTRTKTKTLRQLGTLLMTALGEPSANVSALPVDVYPPVSWECEAPAEAARQLFERYNFSVALGFGSDAVKVVALGTGASLSTTDRFVGSDTIDTKLVPRYIRNCFSPSVAQVRLILEPVGREPDGSWVNIDDLSYIPGGGWQTVPPYSLSELKSLTEEQYTEANGYVRRAYRVKGFADDTWNLPDGSGYITGLTDILPLYNRLLEKEDLRTDDSYQPFRVYGKYWKEPDETAQPPAPNGTITDTGDQVVGRRSWLDGENGILVFEEPIFFPDGGGYQAAELWLETTIRVRDLTTYAWRHYEYDVEIEPAGFGYSTVKHDERAETIVEYDGSHSVVGESTNQVDLDALGDAWAAMLATTFASTVSSYVAYNKPKLTLRCDGAITQIQHILTCGEHGHAANRTTASRNFEFDRGVLSRAQRIANRYAMAGMDLFGRNRRQAFIAGNADD